MYLVSESVESGCLIIYYTRTDVGAACKPQDYREGDKMVTGFKIGIDRPND